MKQHYLLCSLLALVSPVAAQTMNSTINLEVRGASGDNLSGQPVLITHNGYGVNYGSVTLDNEGKTSLQVYAGEHTMSIERPGYVRYTTQFDAPADGSVTVPVALVEDIQAPTALTAEYKHDVFTCNGTVSLSWNMEPDIFFDDFESYEPFAVQFGEWSGLDLDDDIAAPLAGSYPNRGSKQYATIINPLSVEPAWWYDYPVLRPYSGKQYAGFIRTNSGVANNDWLITPSITPSHNNVFEFLAKSADVYNEKFQVYVTTKTDNPSAEDFTKLNSSNYETTTYKGWRRFAYDISQYEGISVKFAIRYMSSANNGGAFMMMVDNVRVGKPASSEIAKSRRVANMPAMKSTANPNETFEIRMNGQLIGTTDAYAYEINDVTPGDYLFGVTAVYIDGRSDESTIRLDLSEKEYCNLKFTFSVPEGMQKAEGVVTLTDNDSGESVSARLDDNMNASFPYLPYGEYSMEVVPSSGYAVIEQSIIADSPVIEKHINLNEKIVTPVNLATSCDKESGDVTLTWNKNSAFTDSFEEYEDFAQNKFGDWLGFNLDNHITYPIALNNYIINYPGASTQQAPDAVGPIVFNAWETVPPMLPDDPAMNAPTGNKQILMFSPQLNGSNKWIVSPEIDVMDGYVMRITAKSYTSMYPESIEFGVTTDLDGDPATMHIIAEAKNMDAEQWTTYEAPLNEYSGQKVRIGIHHVSYDTFFAQLDDFYVGNGQPAGADVDAGNVVEYEIYIDETLYTKTSGNEIVLKGLSEGEHTLGITAVYATGRSDMATIKVNVTSGILNIQATDEDCIEHWFRPDGTEVAKPEAKGIYIVVKGNKTGKIAY